LNFKPVGVSRNQQALKGLTGIWVCSRSGLKGAGKPDVRNYKLRGGGRTEDRETSLIASLM